LTGASPTPARGEEDGAAVGHTGSIYFVCCYCYHNLIVIVTIISVIIVISTSARIYCDPLCLFVCLLVGWFGVRLFVSVFDVLVRIRPLCAIAGGQRACAAGGDGVLQTFLARDSICWARYMLSPVRPSVRLTHGWISRKRLNLGSCNFHHTVATSLYFLQHKFHPEISTGSPERLRHTRVNWGKPAIFVILTLSLGGCTC